MEAAASLGAPDDPRHVSAIRRPDFVRRSTWAVGRRASLSRWHHSGGPVRECLEHIGGSLSGIGRVHAIQPAERDPAEATAGRDGVARAWSWVRAMRWELLRAGRAAGAAVLQQPARQAGAGRATALATARVSNKVQRAAVLVYSGGLQWA